MRRTVWPTALLVVALSALAFHIGAAGAVETRTVLMNEWRALYLAGQKAGFEHVLTRGERTATGTYFVTTVHAEFSLSRAGVTLNLTSHTVVREDEQGRVVEFESKGAMGPPTRGVLEGERFAVTTMGVQGDSTRYIPPPKGLGPWATQRLGREKGYEPGTSYSVLAFFPEAPETDVVVNVEVGPREAVEVFDVRKWLHRLSITTSLMRGVVSTYWVDGEGTDWLSRTMLTPDVMIETRKTTRQFAMAPSEPAELLVSSYIIPDLPIERPRQLDGLQVLLRAAGEADEVPVPPTGPEQTVRVIEQGVLVTVNRVKPPADGYKLPYAGQEYADLLRANKWLEVEDELIRRMAREAVGGSTDAVMAARRIEAYVDRKIRAKGLGVGMATAAETARQLAGDCSEHAVLAAALARAAGMPSRVVGGMAYVEDLPGADRGGFGYHMWAEVYVGRWLPIDPALGAHDATHIVLFRSDMNEPGAEIAMATAIMRFLGRVRIHIVRTTY